MCIYGTRCIIPLIFANAPFSTLYAFYKTLVFCIISLAMINLAIKKYHNIIGGGSDDN